jgi:uncharacterized delta-60 repeat protein
MKTKRVQRFTNNFNVQGAFGRIWLTLFAALFATHTASAQLSLEWARRFNGVGDAPDERFAGMKTDQAGNVIVAGSTYVGEINVSGDFDFVTVKYDSNGNQLWSVPFDGGFDDMAKAVAVDAAGNVYVTGESFTAPMFSDGVTTDVVTIKYDPNGNELWVRRHVSLVFASPRAMAVDRVGNVIVVGEDYGFLCSGFQLDVLVLKYDTNGNLAWSRRYDQSETDCNNTLGPSAESGASVAVDGAGSIYVAGAIFGGIGFPATFLVLKYTPDGDQAWARNQSLGGLGDSMASHIVVDAVGNSYVAGFSRGWALENDTTEDADIAVVKYNPDGSTAWAARYDGAGLEDVVSGDLPFVFGRPRTEALALDRFGNVIVTGGSEERNLLGQIDSDAVTVKYDPNGVQLWAVRHNGNDTDAFSFHNTASSVATDFAGNVYIAGTSPALNESDNFFAVKYSPNGTLLADANYNGGQTFIGGTSDRGYAIALDQNGNIYVGGQAGSPTDGLDDFLVVKYTRNDDQPLPTISIGGAAAAEGESGTQEIGIVVGLSEIRDYPVTVDFATADGTATAGVDYEATSGTVTFAPGQQLQPIIVRIHGDVLPEPNETFVVTLSNPTNGQIGEGQATVVITNDDEPLPTVAITTFGILFSEGDSGSQEVAVTLGLSGSRNYPVSVDFATVDQTAIAPEDYEPISGTLTFAPGQLVKTVTVQVNGDTLIEPDETFLLNFFNPVNAQIRADSESLTFYIPNDEQPFPTFAVTGFQFLFAEGDSGSEELTVTLGISGSRNYPVSVDFATADGTATAPEDYQPVSGTVTFAPGEIVKTVTVQVNGDTLIEPDESFVLNFFNPVNAQIRADSESLTINIPNDEQPFPTISIAGPAVIEGDEGTQAVAVQVGLSEPRNYPVTVDYATADGTATADDDYLAGSGTVTFEPGEQLKSILISINGDTLSELNESFFVNLSNPINAEISEGQALVFIMDDDEANADTDGDGVPDADDACPLEPPSADLDADRNGCTDSVTGLTQIVQAMSIDAAFKEGILARLTEVQRAVRIGKTNVAENMLQAIINEVRAQRGKKLSDAQADLLIAYATNLILLI